MSTFLLMRKKIFWKIAQYVNLSTGSVHLMRRKIFWKLEAKQSKAKQSKAMSNMSIWPPYSVHTVHCTNLPRQHLRSFFVFAVWCNQTHCFDTTVSATEVSVYNCTIEHFDADVQLWRGCTVHFVNIKTPDTRQPGAVDTLDSFCRLDRRFWHGHNFLDAIASPSTYPRACQSVGKWVSGSVSQWVIVSDWRLLSHLQALRACFTDTQLPTI